MAPPNTTSPLQTELHTQVPDALQIFREHAPFAWRVLRRLGVPESDVSDVCQEVFIVVHKKLGSFEGKSCLRTWLYGICTRVAADYRKRVLRRREIVTDFPPEPAIHESAEYELRMREARALLDRILETLDDDKREVFVLYEIEELPMKEVAMALGCPLQTAYSRLHAARAHVTDAVEQLNQEGRAAS